MAAREFLAGHPQSRQGARASHAGHDRAGARRGVRDPACRGRRARRPAGGHRSMRAADCDDDRDRALAAEIATGSQRWRAALDHLIEAAASKRPIERLDPEIVDILRLSAYQLLHLTRVPASAVVDDAVEADAQGEETQRRGLRQRGAAIAFATSGPRCRFPPARRTRAIATAALDYLSITLSHPRWLVSRWLDRLRIRRHRSAGCSSTTRRRRLTLRANRLRITPEAAGGSPRRRRNPRRAGHFAPDALIVEAGQPAGRAPGVMEPGLFVVQDEASQLVVAARRRAPGRSRAGLLRVAWRKDDRDGGRHGRHRTDRRLRCPPDGASNCCERTVAASGASDGAHRPGGCHRRPALLGPVFDCVLLDAPCSGLGTLRRDPDIRWRRRESDLAALAAAQRRMLRACRGLRRTGRAAHLRDLLERARGERSTSSTPSSPRLTPSRAVDARDDCAASAGGCGRRARLASDPSPSSRPRSVFRRRLRAVRAEGSAVPCLVSRSCRTISDRMALGNAACWSAGKLLVLAGALVATYVVFAAASMRMALRAREVRFPTSPTGPSNDATALAVRPGARR